VMTADVAALSGQRTGHWGGSVCSASSAMHPDDRGTLWTALVMGTMLLALVYLLFFYRA
jgi:hypothetical protein